MCEKKAAPAVDKQLRFPLACLSRLRMAIDGRGVTTLVIGAGCPLRCRYCPNTFTWQADCRCTAVTARELVDLVRQDDLYFQATGGGITFGGGEPLLHAVFIREFRALTGDKWRITAETSLNVPEENLHIAMECVDEFMVDIKDMNPEIYRRYTGADNARVLENLKLLLRTAAPARVLVRTPHIPKFNTPDDVARSIAQLRSLGVSRIDEFQYHTDL